MSIELTHTQEKKAECTAKHANNERGQSMPGGIAGQSRKVSALLAGVEANVPASAGDLNLFMLSPMARFMGTIMHMARWRWPSL